MDLQEQRRLAGIVETEEPARAEIADEPARSAESAKAARPFARRKKKLQAILRKPEGIREQIARLCLLLDATDPALLKLRRKQQHRAQKRAKDTARALARKEAARKVTEPKMDTL